VSGVNGRWRGRRAHYDTAIVVGSSTTKGVPEPCHSRARSDLGPFDWVRL
jgi:hypothetical protein